MANLETLCLDNNQIGDTGLSSFATACAKGALANLTELYLGGNPASPEAQQKAMNAIENPRGE